LNDQLAAAAIDDVFRLVPVEVHGCDLIDIDHHDLLGVLRADRIFDVALAADKVIRFANNGIDFRSFQSVPSVACDVIIIGLRLGLAKSDRPYRFTLFSDSAKTG
jgi:hypothetical protein